MKESEILALLQGKEFVQIQMTKEEFESSDGISAQDVKTIANSSIWAWGQSKKEKIKQSSRLARAVREKILDPDRFWDSFCLEEDYPKPAIRTTKEGRDIYNEWKELNPHKGRISASEWQKEYIKWKYPDLKKEIINEEEYDVTTRITQNIKERHLYLGKILSKKNDTAFFWKTPSGVILKSYPDVVNDDYVVNVFSINNCSIDRVENLIGKEDLYIDAYFDQCPHFKKTYLQVFGETSFPNDVVVHPIGSASVDLGESITHVVLETLLKYREARKKGEKFSTGYRSSLTSVDVPAYLFNKDEVVKRRLGYE